MGRLNEGTVRKLVDFLFRASKPQKTKFRKKIEKIKDAEIRDELLDKLDIIDADIEKNKERWEKEHKRAVQALYDMDPEIGKIWDF